MLALVAAMAACRESGEPAVQTLTLQATDGVAISAALYVPRQESPPGLILVHRLGAGRDSWDLFAHRARQAGILTIAIDLRGHGDSRQQGESTLDYRSFSDSDWRDALRDLDAARKHLIEAGADRRNLFVAGEALGASLALQFAVENLDIQGVVLLSPGLDYEGIQAESWLGQLAQRPVLMLWAEGDAYAAASADTLRRIAPGHIEVHTYPGTPHGTNIFSVSPQSIGQVLVWLDQMLYATDSPDLPEVRHDVGKNPAKS